MQYAIRKRQYCRVCASSDAKLFLHFDALPFTDDFVSESNLGTEFLAPLDVYWCPDCGTVQTLHDVDVMDYYREYRYSVSHSPFARGFMKRLAQESFRRFQLKPGDNVIEIGSGDGRQLSCFQELGARVLGFEPSADLTSSSRARGVPVVRSLFSADSVHQIPKELTPAQIVLLTYTFDHLPDPLPFLEAVHDVIDPERGVLLIEVHDLEKILTRREYCLFAHEHSVYLTKLTMKRLLERAGFRLITATLLPEKECRGNSLLVAASTKDCDLPVDDLPCGRSDLEEWSTYSKFADAVRESLLGLKEYVRSQKAEGIRLAGYGAGGRGVMSMAMADVTHDEISYVCDRNPSFHGLLLPRSHVPVVCPKRLLSNPADEVVVFSFGYMDEIRSQLRDYVLRGGRLRSLLELV